MSTDAAPGLLPHPGIAQPREVTSRRELLRGAVVVGGLAGAALMSTACSPAPPSPEQVTAEQLVPLAQSAIADAVDAQNLIASHPDRAAALAVITTQRRTHARLLEDEIARLHPAAYASDPPSLPALPSASNASATASNLTTPPPTLDGLRDRMRREAADTAQLAPTKSAYVAGMLGSIGVALDCLVQVQLS